MSKPIINYNPSERSKKLAVKVSKLKQTLTYEEIKKILPYQNRYLIELKKIGDRIRKEQDETPNK